MSLFYTILILLSFIFDTCLADNCIGQLSSGSVTELHISNDYVSPDGYNRSAILVNNEFPAPPIRVCKNDEVVVKVFNKLTDDSSYLETSVHWHGILQHKSNWADGTAFITQCPLHPGDAFEYRFNVTDQTGTYWYHSHYQAQYCDGLRGPLIVYDPDDPLACLYDVDDETTIITLADWYHLSSSYLGTLFSGVQSNTTLINGLGRYPGGPESPFSVVNVRSGYRYRFRILSLSCAPLFNFTIDGHRMTIIEVDGNEVSPVEVDSIPILTGQRYSVVITANQTIGSYWIRALSNVPNASFDGGQNMAILRYDGALEEDPTSDPGPYDISFDEGKLHPLSDAGAPGIPEIGKADVNIVMKTGINSTNWFTMNDVPFEDPSVPVLLQILSGARHPSQLLKHGLIYELPPGKVIEISFPGPTIAPHFPHPMHLHGHTFDVVRVAGSNETNFKNPVRRDVVSMGSEEWDNVTVRFVTDNPGPWFLHCHIDWHLHHGFAAVFAEAPDEAAQQQLQAAPGEWYLKCLKHLD